MAEQTIVYAFGERRVLKCSGHTAGRGSVPHSITVVQAQQYEAAGQSQSQLSGH